MKFVASGMCRMVYTLYTGLERVTLGKIMINYKSKKVVCFHLNNNVFSLGWSHMLGRVGIVALVASLDIGNLFH